MTAPVSVVRAASAAYRASLGPTFEASAIAYASGRALAVAGHPEQALHTWLDALDAPTARGWPVMMNALVEVALELGDVQATVDRLATRADHLPELHLWIGVLAARAGDPTTAERAFATAEARTTGDLRFTATTERLKVLLALGRVGDAIDAVTAAISAQPAHEVSLRSSRAGLLNRAGRPEAALEDLSRVLQLAPDFAPAWLNQGSALARLDRLAEAREALDRAVTLDPSLAGPAEALRP